MDWIGRLLAWLEPWLAYWLSLIEAGSLPGLGAAAVAGVALGLSPITYLFMPAVVGYAGGGKDTTRRRAAGLSLAFVLGVSGNRVTEEHVKIEKIICVLPGRTGQRQRNDKPTRSLGSSEIPSSKLIPTSEGLIRHLVRTFL